MKRNSIGSGGQAGGMSRRSFIGTAGAAVAGMAFVPVTSFGKRKRLPDSVINGVRIGVIAPYAFHGLSNSAEELLGHILNTGISAVEMQSPPVEAYAGAPRVRRFFRPPPDETPQQKTQREAEQAAQRAKLSEWRTSAGMDAFRELRKIYNDAGLIFYGYKQSLTPQMSDAEYDYVFTVAKTLGADQVTMEMPWNDEKGTLTDRIGRFAAKHGIMVAYHAHTQANYNLWDRAVWQSKYNGLNLDIGHYVAGTGDSPIPLMEKHWDRIGSLHLKDRKVDDGPNMPWGQGDTPIAEVLQLMRDRKASFPATVELEYPIPEGSDAVQEISKCLEYCRQALT